LHEKSESLSKLKTNEKVGVTVNQWTTPSSNFHGERNFVKKEFLVNSLAFSYYVSVNSCTVHKHASLMALRGKKLRSLEMGKIDINQ